MSMIWFCTAGKAAQRRRLLLRLEDLPEEKELALSEIAELPEISQNAASESCCAIQRTGRGKRGDCVATVGEIGKAISTCRSP